MFFRVLCTVLLGVLPALIAGAELSYEVVAQVGSEGGFAAANAFRDLETGRFLSVVTFQGDLGVVCLDFSGNRLWSYPMEPPCTAAPAVADLDGDGREDVVAADSKGNVAALNSEGALMWSAQVPGGMMADSSVAIADLDGDGELEVLLGDMTGTVSCLDNRGGLRWRFMGDGTRMGPVLVADIYDSPGAEIIVSSHDQHIYALASNGNLIWDIYSFNDLFPNTTPILADVDGDGVPELYIAGGLHHFYRIDLESHRVVFEENVYLHLNNCIAAADIDLDGKEEVVFGNKGGAAWCYGESGFEWTQELPNSNLYAAPLFVNLDEDPQLEMIWHSVRGDVQFLDTDGSVLFSKALPCNAQVAPLAGDFDGDGLLDLVVTRPGGAGGKSEMLFTKVNVPYEEDLRVPTSFAGNRANSGRPRGAATYALLPVPVVQSVDLSASASREGEPPLLSGTNTWRFDVKNPEQKRMALVLEVDYPNGEVQRFVRHFEAPSGRGAFSFDVKEPGDYRVSSRLVEADVLQGSLLLSEVLNYRGLEGDAAYLDEGLFAEIERTIEGWRASNPGAAEEAHSRLVGLRGMLLGLLASEGADGVGEMALLIDSARRLWAKVSAGKVLAPEGSFYAWEFTPWAYFNGRDTVAAADDRTEALAASLCQEEYESLALNVTNVSGETVGVRVLCAELKGPDDAVLSVDDHIEFRRSQVVPTYRREMVWDALPKLDQGRILCVPAYETAQLWITVNAKGLAPGEYVAQLRLRSLEPDPTEVAMPITLKVHDLALPRPRPLSFCMWSYDGGIMGTDHPQALRELVEHGTTVFFGRSPSVQCDEDGNLVGEIDFSATDESVARLSPHGILLFTGPQGGVRGPALFSEGWRKGFITYLRAWAAHMKEIGVGYEGWALYPYDEPSTPYTDITRNLVRVAKVVREADPNILIYADPTSGTTMETVEMLSGLVDIWCPSLELLDRLGPELIPAAKKVAKEVWYYDAPSRGKTLSCLGHYRWWIWYAWNNGFTGAGWWVFAHHGDADRWDGPNETGNNFCTAYDCPEGVLTSKRWEATRDGIEDYEYLWLLREAVREAEGRGVAEAELAGAKRLLGEAAEEMEALMLTTGDRISLTPDSVPVYDDVTERLQAMREEIVAACLALRGE